MAEKDLGVPFNVSEIEWGSDIKDQLTKFCGRYYVLYSFKNIHSLVICFQFIFDMIIIFSDFT